MPTYVHALATQPHAKVLKSLFHNALCSNDETHVKNGIYITFNGIVCFCSIIR